MTPSRPYFMRAVYDWVLDNKMTPYIVVNATYPKVQVPERYVENGKIVLNVSPQAVSQLSMDLNALEFDARFSGVVRHLYVPVNAVQAIYAFENGRGMMFNDEEHGGDDDGGPKPPENRSLIGDASAAKKKGKPQLKIVK